MDGQAYWYKDAIIYEVHVKTFFDSDSNGIGDFKGLTEKLDYLHDLGITAIWLLPFFPSPLKDDGYDTSDYKNVHPNYGTLADFKVFLKEAHRRNIRVIIELIINHTSDQHPWFQRARKAKKGSVHRNYYVWSETPDKYKQARIIFKDFEVSNWTWDPIGQAYFWHRFYSHQPDLNFANPAVQSEIFRILDFWLKMGVDGFRLDAVPYLYEKEGTNCENLQETHEFLKKLRNYVDSNYQNRILLAEANQWPEDAAQYFGNGDECHMAFHFPIMPRLFMAIYLEDSLPIIEIAAQTPLIHEKCQWALFLRNHDELTLEMVTDEERDYMFRIYAYDPKARINLGIRRRLAPLLKNDRRKIELMNSLLFSLIGTPVLYYGDEIGMGDNIYLGDRDGVRTPMQWSPDRNAGFSKVNPQRLYLPPITDPEYHYEMINVETQLHHPFSLFFWTKQMIALRKKHKAFGRGSTHFLKTENPKILAFFRQYQDELLLIVSNISRHVQFVQLDLSKYKEYHLIELFSGSRFPPIGELPFFLTLSPYSYYWFAIGSPQKSYKINLSEPQLEKIPLLSFSGTQEKIFSPLVVKSLQFHLFHYLAYSNLIKRKIESVILLDYFVFPTSEEDRIFLLLVQLNYNEYESQNYFLTLQFLSSEKALQFPEKIVSKWVDINKKELFLCDISHNNTSGQTIFDYFLKNNRLKGKNGELQRVYLYTRYQENIFTVAKESLSIKFENGHVVFSFQNFKLKIFLFVEEGLSVDIEMRKFLTFKTSFTQFFPLLGYVEYHGVDQKNTAFLEMIRTEDQGFNALNYSINEAEIFFENIQSYDQYLIYEKENTYKKWLDHAKESLPEIIEKSLGGYLGILKSLADCTSQFHLAMSSDPNDPHFCVEFYTPFYQRSLYQTARKKVFDFFNQVKKLQTKETNSLYEEVLSYEEKTLVFFEKYIKLTLEVQRFRIHGNFCLDQLFFNGKEFFISDFEPSANLTFNEKRYKRCPLRDIANMLYSFVEVTIHALNSQEQKGLVNSGNRHIYEEVAKGWSIWTGVTFIKNYLEKIEGAGIIPSQAKIVEELLSLFFIEKILEKAFLFAQNQSNLNYLLKLFIHWISIYTGEKNEKE